MDADTEASLLLPSLVSAAMLACAVVLALVCLHCRDNGPPVSIREACDTGEYTPSTQFILVHPHQPTTRLTSGLLSPFIPASDCVSQRSRRSDREATESESTHSYQNSHDEQDLSVSITGDYILVLPDDEAPATNRSSASTPSSDELHDYENIPKEHTQRSPSEDRDYLNVIALPEAGETPMLSQRDDDDNDNDDDSDSDDSQGNYVNQPSVMSSSPLHDETGGAPVVPERGGV
ncbi:linker for activation of T-cells family member 1 isoform X2 [Hippocampus comes]|uniref:linker for activation of T-cells family member 1 isoform X2 n=1 Tax=Hippocampus comes TaxID=109280 RepID=UPI00094E7F35|nr:PREDICTED: uncharacterized protein LOC109513750 isoform X2 [Hippocampus comes]